MKTFRCVNLVVGDVVEEPNPRDSSKPRLFRVLSVGFDDRGRSLVEVEEIDPGWSLRFVLWVVTSIATICLAAHLLWKVL